MIARIRRSLFLRFFLASAATMFAVWLLVLAWQALVMQSEFERVQAAETRAWARQILTAVTPVAGDADKVRAVAKHIETIRHRLFTEIGYAEPRWRLQLRRGKELLYASPPGNAGMSIGKDAQYGRWEQWTQTDPATGMTIHLEQQSVIAWNFAFANAGRQFAPLLYSFPFLLVTAWLTIRFGLRPIRALVAQVRSRSPANLAALTPIGHDELAPLATSVDRLMASLARQLEHERHFAIDAAHQLKTPLAIVQTNADLILTSRTPELVRRAGADMREAIGCASHVIHQLLELARVDNAGVHEQQQPTDLVQLLRARLALAATIALKRNIEVELNVCQPCVLPLRAASMAALLDNLLDNAVKYSPDNSRIEIWLKDTANGPEIGIADAGPGIPEEYRHKIFSRFFRVPGQDQPGSGLGLAIAARAAAVNGAILTIENNAAGHGLRATVRFNQSVHSDNPLQATS